VSCFGSAPQPDSSILLRRQLRFCRGRRENFPTRKQGEPIESCTILTTDANELMMPIHDRMPVIIPPEQFDIWLDPAVHDEKVLSEMLRPSASDDMTAYPISTLVNSPKNDVAACIEPAR